VQERSDLEPEETTNPNTPPKRKRDWLKSKLVLRLVQWRKLRSDKPESVEDVVSGWELAGIAANLAEVTNDHVLRDVPPLDHSLITVNVTSPSSSYQNLPLMCF
jgi:hypothetical protein